MVSAINWNFSRFIPLSSLPRFITEIKEVEFKLASNNRFGLVNVKVLSECTLGARCGDNGIY